MKRFSRRNFSQIMINNSLKHELDQLKSIVSKEVLSSWNLSYGNVISFLVNQFMKSRKQEYDLEKKLISSVKFSNSNLKVASKLEPKIVVSFSLE